MAGLAAALNAPSSIDAIAWALATRGAEGAVCRLTGPGEVCLDLAVRAVMPAITRVVAAEEPERGDDRDGDPRSDEAQRAVAALVVDGIASVTALDRGYLERGPAGLVDEGEHAYAVVLADADRGELALACNGAGPSLYYARLDGGWVVASEPGALVHAGVAPEPDVAVVRRFIQTGACDESERTFFAHIRRVLPGEAVVLSTTVSGPVRHPSRWTPPAPPSTEEAIWRSGAGARVGVLVTPGVAGGAVLGAALHQPERSLPLPAFTVTMTRLHGPAARTPDVLRSLPHDVVRPTELVAGLDLSTLDRFLLDMGEPVPDLGTYLLWTAARELSGDIDSLVDSTTGTRAARERVGERLLAHYGVAVPAPLRGPSPDETPAMSVLRRALPPPVARLAVNDPARAATSAQVVLALRDEVAAALVPPRPWSDASAGITALRRLHAGESARGAAPSTPGIRPEDRQVPEAGSLAMEHRSGRASEKRTEAAGDADALLRAFLVERWLTGLGAPAAVTEAAEPPPSEELLEVPLREPDDVVVDGDVWRRTPVRTAPVAAGDHLLANTAFHVANALTARSELPLGPWFVVVSGKVVAVSQKRVNPVVAIRPTWAAKVLARLARRRWPHLAQPWTMQVAIDHSGLGAVLRATLLRRPMPGEAAVYPPRVGAMTPADVAVIRPPFKPDDMASSLVAAVRLALAREHWRTFAGVAVVSADDAGCRVLGFASGPAADAAPPPRTLLSLVLADNPAGQGAQRTPVVIVAQQTAATVEQESRLRDRESGTLLRDHFALPTPPSRV